MKSTDYWRNGWGLLLLAVALAGWTGCQPRPAVPGPATMSGSDQRGTFTCLRWQGGPTILICSDLTGSHSWRAGGSFTDLVYRGHGHHAAHDGRRFEWQTENSTNLVVKLTLAGKAYDLAKGTVFVVTVSGGGTKVRQLARDLSSLHAPADCQALIRQDADLH